MAIALSAKITVSFVPDGCGPQEVPSAQAISFQTPLSISAGGNSPTVAQLSAVMDNFDTSITVQLTAALGQIQGWGTGGN